MKHMILVVPLLLAALSAQARGLGWQEAVAHLASEQTRAETCASLVKRFGSATQVAEGQIAYGEAKAEMDAVIAGLVVGLAEDQRPESLPDLEARLMRGVEQREAFCADAAALVPGSSGEKSAIVDLVANTIGPLIDALTAVYLDARSADRLTRATIQTQLEATQWPRFGAIQP